MSYTNGEKQTATIVARAKAQKSRMAWYAAVTAAEKGLTRAHKTNAIVAKAVAKAQKLRLCYELDETKVKALEELP
jgi:biotin synthase-like enzyme